MVHAEILHRDSELSWAVVRQVSDGFSVVDSFGKSITKEMYRVWVRQSRKQMPESTDLLCTTCLLKNDGIQAIGSTYVV
jgi:hypothetical protein